MSYETWTLIGQALFALTMAIAIFGIGVLVGWDGGRKYEREVQERKERLSQRGELR